MNKRRRLLAALLASVLLLAGLGACSDDDGGGSDVSAEGGGDAGGDDAAASADNTVVIEEKDYAYGVQGTAKAGVVTLDVRNVGKELHMLGIAKLKAGKGIKELADVVKQMSEGPPPGAEEGAAAEGPPEGEGGGGEGGGGGDPFEALVDGDPDQYGRAGSFLFPGFSQKQTTELEAGTYGLLCFIPTAGEGAPHIAKGMFATLEVTEEKSEAKVPAPTAEFTIEDGKVTGPTPALKSGENVIKVTAKGESHEVLLATTTSKDPIDKVVKDTDDYFTKVFESGEPPPADYVTKAPAQIAASTFNLQDGQSVTLTINLKPGRYVIGCNAVENDDDEDQANDVDHVVKERVEFTVT
jgi:hypothetical protein